MSPGAVMGARKVAELLDSAETDLHGVSRSMLTADPIAMQESQVVLEQLVGSLRGLKAAVGTSKHVWPSAIRERLTKFQVRLRRLQALADAALSAVLLRSQSPAFSTGYTAHGVEAMRPELTTLTLDC